MAITQTPMPECCKICPAIEIYQFRSTVDKVTISHAKHYAREQLKSKEVRNAICNMN